MAVSGALEDAIDRWIAGIEDAIEAEVGDDAPDFDERVKNRFESELVELTRESTGNDVYRILFLPEISKLTS